MTIASDKSCSFCAKPTGRLASYSSFKHIFFFCQTCGNLTRYGKSSYPTDALVKRLSSNRISTKIANRLVPPFMRRSDAEAVGYASYGEYFKSILNSDTKFEGFTEVKRQAYLKEPDKILSLFKKHEIDLGQKSILDVSGGPGTFAHFMRENVHKITVSEYDPMTVNDMQAHLKDIRVFQADLNDLWTDEEQFDVVLYRSCIVFARDFGKHFSTMKSRITDGGYVYIYTARPTLGNSLRWQYEDYTYNVLYSESYIKEVLSSQGFEVMDMGTTDEYRHYLRHFSFREAFPLLYGIWNAVLPNRPHSLDACAFWILAKKL